MALTRGRRLRVGGVVAATAVVLALALAAAELPSAEAREDFYVRSPRQVERAMTKVIREQIRAEREEHVAKGGDAKEVKFTGFSRGSPLHERAEKAAKERGTFRERTSSARLAAALLPQLDEASVVLAIGDGTDGQAGGPLLLGGGDGSGDGSGSGEDGDDAFGGQLTLTEHRIASYKESMKLMDDVSTGAIANTGALPRDASQWTDLAVESANRDPSLRSHEIQWLLATSEIEDDDAVGIEEGEQDLLEEQALEDNLKDWFEAGNGRITYVEADVTGRVPFLRAKEPLNEGEVVLRIPLQLTLSKISARNVRTRGGYLGDHMKDLFKENQRWGLAMMLLHEHFKETSGRGSKWGPFVRSLRVSALTKSVMQEIRGTYASQLYREWEEDAEALSKWIDRKHFCLHHDLCARNKDQHVPGSFTRSDVKWAIWVVRRFALPVRKRTTGSEFLALLPYSHLLKHQREAGGSVHLELDNTISITAGNTLEGEAVGIDMGALGDAQLFLKFHAVPEDGNDDNHVHLSLPGGGGSREDMFWQLDTLRKWRKELGLPPRMSDLWRITDSLHLFGDDEEEQKKLSRSNTKIAGLPLPTDQVTAEEQLMLFNGVDMAQAQVMVVEVEGEAGAQLYAAPDPEDDERAKEAMEDLAAAVLQLQKSVAVGQVDNATLTVINKTRNFLEHGVMPWKGLDEIDQLLLRKLSILKQCGPADGHRINAHNVSLPLLCALRVHLMNQTDLEVVCPKADGPWFEPKCEDDSFNNTMPVSLDNEEAAIQAVEDSINVLLAGYPTSLEHDEELLRGTTPEEGGNGLGPKARAAVLMRVREKTFLQDALAELTERREALPNATFQVNLQAIALAEKAKRHAEQKARMERLRAEALAPKVSVTLPVDIDGGKSVDLVVLERQDAGVVIREFMRNNSIPNRSYQTLFDAVMARGKPAPPLLMAMPLIIPDGTRQVLTVVEGQNVTTEAERFCLMHNVSDAKIELVKSMAMEKLEARLKRRVLVTVPVTGLDGRRLQLQVRQGEQHDLYTTTMNFCLAYGMGEGVVLNLANEVNRRLPNVILNIPVNAPGMVGLKLLIRAGDQHELEDVVRGFCEINNLPNENVPVLLRQARGGLNPGSLVL